MKKSLHGLSNFIDIRFIIKYFIGLAFCFLAYMNERNIFFLISVVIEFLIIVVFSNILITNYKRIGYIIHSIIYGLFCVQLLVKYFSSSYLQKVMLTNIDSIQDLYGNIVSYSVAIVFFLVALILPYKGIDISRKNEYKILCIFLGCELLMSAVLGYVHSPIAAYIDLSKQYIEDYRKNVAIKNQPNCTSDFYKSGVYDLWQWENALSENPNVVLILTEGLSQNIIDDDRNIMPNIRKYQKKSLNFINYYNHTFPTYRGISGQLYSGYQLDNYDKNSLVSIQSILKDRGYNTIFINTEPQNIDFTVYLNNLGFDEVVSDYEIEYSGEIDTVSDKEAYELLFDKMEQESEKETPFLIVIYTFGTHASLDSPDERYGDGSNPELNKFYNLDYQFGKFMKKWKKSNVTNDTVLAFTTDHATYADVWFNNAFPDYERANVELDRVPFFIYHKSINKNVIDAAGRNSLDMVPTLLDFINISGENYFLGETLFMVKDNNNGYDTSFTDGSNYYDTTDGVISDMPDVKKEILVDHITKYYSAKLQEPLK